MQISAFSRAVGTIFSTVPTASKLINLRDLSIAIGTFRFWDAVPGYKNGPKRGKGQICDQLRFGEKIEFNEIRILLNILWKKEKSKSQTNPSSGLGGGEVEKIIKGPRIVYARARTHTNTRVHM